MNGAFGPQLIFEVIMTVKLFRLITGEDLISKVKSETDTAYTLDAPAVIMLQDNGDKVGVGIAPYMPMIEGNIYLYKDNVVADGSPNIQLENEYNVRFGSGLVVASAGSIQT